MSDKRKAEVIRDLNITIQNEKNKFGGGNSELIEKLEKKLDSILDGTHVSKFKNKTK
jgi:hypothetical protein